MSVTHLGRELGETHAHFLASILEHLIAMFAENFLVCMASAAIFTTVIIGTTVCNLFMVAVTFVVLPGVLVYHIRHL